MPNKEIQEYLLRAFPEHTRQNTVKAVKEGLFLFKDTVDANPVFKNPARINLLGQLQRICIIERIEHSCKVGNLPFTTKSVKMKKGPFSWSEIYSSNICAHLVRTSSANAFPSNSPNRQDKRVTNQLELPFEDNNNISNAHLPTIMPLYAYLTFGTTEDELSHLCWGIPSANTAEWLGYLDITKYDIDLDSKKSSSNLAKVSMQFKESIKAALKAEGRVE